ncbi:IS66 family transposase [Fodinicurvata sediminis]|uniref:IS66 family transposase n=1 Tax=Fodinicurvata sediminis TaxID=1121832 RepID=UPI00047A47A4|nr:IS66 family transposase [Fodinicurvata sediminis]
MHALDPAELAELPAHLRGRVEALQAEAAALAAQNARLEHLVREFQNAVYGKRSEKLDADSRQLSFEDLEVAIASAESAQAAAAPSAPTRKRKPPQRNLGRLPAELPRVEEVLEPEIQSCPCGCAGELVCIGEERSERLDIEPARFRVLVTRRPKYACQNCDGGVVQAAAPAHLIEGGLPSEGLLAHVLANKYADHCPLYRQAQIFRRHGLELDRSTLAGWVGKAAFHLAPLAERLATRLKQSEHLFMDETRAPVLDPGRGRTHSGYLWALARDQRGWGGQDPPGVVYFYAPGRAGAHGEDFLEGFTGTLQVDGYAGYRRLAAAARKPAPLVLAHCWAHARRKLKEVHERDGSPVASEGLQQIAAFYHIEAEIRGLSPEARLAARQARTAPLMAEFEQWLAAQRARLSGKSRLGEKLAYISKHWEGLQCFLQDGRVEIDSNAVENRIRPLALNRKNALFAGHHEGARNWGIIASLIETARMNDLEPFAWLKATLEDIARGHPQARLDDLLPWPAPAQA